MVERLRGDRERSLLACCLYGINPEPMVRALVDIPASAFTPENREILLAIQALWAKGLPVGVLEMAQELGGGFDAQRRILALEPYHDSEALFFPRLKILREASNLNGDDAEPRLPKAAWFGLFETWKDVVSPCTEASFESIWAAFLLACGLVLGRTVCIHSPRPLYPNFYVLLLGATGDAKKSTVLWLCESLIRRVEEPVEFLRGIVSSEGIYERLKGEVGVKVLGYVDELRVLIAVARRRGTQDILAKLGSLYYLPEEDTLDRRKDPVTVRSPFFSLLAATPLDSLREILGRSEVTGGTLNRFFTVHGPEQLPKPRVDEPSEQAWASVVRPLREIRGKILPIRVGWEDDEAGEVWDRFYYRWKEERRAMPRLVADLTARIPEHILKVALVFVGLSGERRLTAESITHAILVGEYLQRCTLRHLGNIGEDETTWAQRKILEIVRRCGGKMKKRDLQQRLSHDMGADVFRAATRGLIEADRLAEWEERSQGGQKVKMIRTTDDNI